MTDAFKNDCFYFFIDRWRPEFSRDGVAVPYRVGAASGDFISGSDLFVALRGVPEGLSAYDSDSRFQVVEIVDQFHTCLKWICLETCVDSRDLVPRWGFQLYYGDGEVPVFYRALLAVPIEHVPQFITDTPQDRATDTAVKFMRGLLRVGL
jgi:hypothetical protein